MIDANSAVGDLRLFDLPVDERPSARRRTHRRVRPVATGGLTPQQMVNEFHEQFALPRSTTPTVDIPTAVVDLRNNLLREEARELIEACDAGDLTAIADGIADVLYVVYGTAVTYGLDADALVREVHRSNMSKLGDDGQPLRRDDGKILKGPSYSPPQLEFVIAGMTPAAQRPRQPAVG